MGHRRNSHEPTPNIAFHYCRLATLKGVVENREFWLTNIFFMNDFLEVEWFKSLAHTVADELELKINAPSSASHYYRRLAISLAARRFDHIYCGCFSTISDDLSQWRAYGDQARGVCIGLDLGQVEHHNPSPVLELKRVKYDLAEQRQTAADVIEEYRRKLDLKNGIGDVLVEVEMAHAVLSILAVEFKNPSFSAESEVRLIVRPSQTFSSVDLATYRPKDFQEFPNKDVNFIERSGVLVPYTTIAIPAETIREVWLGPRFGGSENELAIKLFMAKHGCDDVAIHRSRASYRGG